MYYFTEYVILFRVIPKRGRRKSALIDNYDSSFGKKIMDRLRGKDVLTFVLCICSDFLERSYYYKSENSSNR